MRALLVVPLAIACAGAAAPTPASTPTPPPAPAVEPKPITPPAKPGIRLSRDVVPLKQWLALDVDPSQPTFSGRATIAVEVNVATDFIWLHGANLTVTHATVGELTATPFVVDDLVGLALPKRIAPGPATIAIAYEARFLTLESTGLFNRQEGSDFYAFTDFEPMDARRAFPCFDQPEFKIPWRVELTVPAGSIAVANTPVEEERAVAGGRTRFRFRETRPLPTYLVAFAVGPFETLPSPHVGAPVRIVFPRGHAAEAAHPAKHAGEILTLFERTLGMPYPYEKLDLIAVPGLGPGAMENPGLVTFRQPYLLNKPEEWNTRRQRLFAVIVAHEIAHMWFGDLVTMTWWDDLWLNESFATWFGAKIVDRWRPEWRGELDAIEDRHRASYADAIPSIRRVRQPVRSIDDALDAFDDITYEKGASVLRMFEAWIGEDKFLEAVSTYLGRHRDGTATAADFLAALGEAAGFDVATPFSTFLDQPGVPAVAVALDCPKRGAPTLRFAQARHVVMGAGPLPPQTWHIPVCVKFGANKAAARACTLVTQAKQSWTPPSMTSCPDWLIANADSIGYYHAYPDGDRAAAAISRGLSKMTPRERAGAAIDVLPSIKGGLVPPGDALAALRRFARDDDSIVVHATLDVTSDLSRTIVGDAERPRWAAFLRDAYGKRAASLGWSAKPGEPHEDALLRPFLLHLVAGEAEDTDLAREARRLADAWLDDRSAVPSDVVDGALGVAARRGDAALFDRMLAAFVATRDPSERRRLIEALAQFREPALASRQLELFLRSDIDARDLRWLFRELSRNTAAIDPLYLWVKQRFDDVAKRFPKTSGATLPLVAQHFCERDRAGDVEAFFRERVKDYPGGAYELERVVERITLCAEVRASHAAAVTEFLSKYGGNP